MTYSNINYVNRSSWYFWASCLVHCVEVFVIV